MEISNIRFDESAKKDMLNLFKKDIDTEGFLVEMDNKEQRVLTKEGEEIKFEDWGGVRRGSEAFIKKDVFSLIKMAKEMK